MNPVLDHDSAGPADHPDQTTPQQPVDTAERPPVEAFDPHFAKRPSDQGTATSTYDPHFG